MTLNTNLQLLLFAMSYSVLNDLAEAMKALDGKKQEYDDWKSTTERTLSAPCGLLVPLHHFSSAHVSLSVSPFFSPLSLRHGFVVVCFEVTICELLCLDGLCHVISGILAGGIPGFRMVLLLLRSPSGMAL